MAESKPKKSASSKPKVFDVAHPSKNVASPTSRPVIVGHTNMIQKDPMVDPVEQPATEEPQAEATKPPASRPKRELVLQPVDQTAQASSEEAPAEESVDTDGIVVDSSITDEPGEEESEAAESPEAEPEIDSTDEAAVETEAETGSEDDSSDPETIEPDQNAEAGSDTAAVDALVAGVNTKKEKKDQEEKEAKRQEEIQALIASRKYNVKTHIPPGKRNFIWLVVLIIIAALAAAGWYIGAGPGRSLWDKKPVVETPVVQSKTEEKSTQSTGSTAQQNAVKTTVFNNPKYGLSFTYPSEWKVASAKDDEFNNRDIITLTSPAETIKTASGGTSEVDSEVYLRTKITVENTKSTSDYASDLVNLASCVSEDVVVENTTLKLLYVDGVNKSPSVSQVSLSPSNCVATGTKFSGNDQVQFSKKANTYIIRTEYIYSDAYLKKIGTTDPDAIKLAQESGVAAQKDSFKAGTNYLKFIELVKSLKEL